MRSFILCHSRVSGNPEPRDVRPSLDARFRWHDNEVSKSPLILNDSHGGAGIMEPQPPRFLTVRLWRAGAKIILGSRYSAARRAYPFGHSGSTSLRDRSTGKN